MMPKRETSGMWKSPLRMIRQRIRSGVYFCEYGSPRNSTDGIAWRGKNDDALFGNSDTGRGVDVYLSFYFRTPLLSLSFCRSLCELFRSSRYYFFCFLPSLFFPPFVFLLFCKPTSLSLFCVLRPSIDSQLSTHPDSPTTGEQQ